MTASQLALRETSDDGATGSEHARDRLWQEVALARADMERRVLEVDAQYSGLSLVGVDIQSKYTQFAVQ